MDDVPWTSTPLVGRSTEMAALLSAVDDAKTRRAGAVLLSGDAGVGKTRLLDEVATGAHERGFGVLVGHCTDFGDAGLPYLPFTEIFGRLAGERPDLVESVLTNFPAIGRLLPTHRLIGAQPFRRKASWTAPPCSTPYSGPSPPSRPASRCW